MRGQRDSKIVVLGNEKGGSGKSTTAMHLAIALLYEGFRVGTVDLDARQGTLTRYFANRFKYIANSQLDIPSPLHLSIEKSSADTDEVRTSEDSSFLTMALDELLPITDYVIVDTPGNDTYLNRLAHQKSDVLITPVNDSLVDLDVLCVVDPDTLEIENSSFYANMVLDLQSRRKRAGEKPIEWIVMRNRLSHLDARNKRDVGDVMGRLSKIYDFKPLPGFGERVIFRELFLKGLTVMDIEKDPETSLSISEITARQEVRRLVREIGKHNLQPRTDADKAAAE